MTANYRASLTLSTFVCALVSGHAIAQELTPSQRELLGNSGIAASPVTEPATTHSPGQAIKADSAIIRCRFKVPLVAQTDGLIKELLVDEGSRLKAGDPVMRIDSRITEAELEVAKKQLQSAEILAEQTANIEFSEAARDLAYKEYHIQKDLWETRSTSFSEIERKRLEAQKAGFSVNMALDDKKKMELDAAVAREQVRASEVKLSLYEVTTPYDGIIVARERSQGEWIRAGDPVAKLVNMQKLKLEVFVKLGSLNPAAFRGARMRVTIGNLEPFETTIGFVSPEIDTPDRLRTVTFIENQTDLNGEWIFSDGMQPIVEIFPNE